MFSIMLMLFCCFNYCNKAKDTNETTSDQEKTSATEEVQENQASEDEGINAEEINFPEQQTEKVKSLISDVFDSPLPKDQEKIRKKINQEIVNFEKSDDENPFNPDQVIRRYRLEYTGLKINMWEPVDQKNGPISKEQFFEDIFINSPQWKLKYGISVGIELEKLSKILGKPDKIDVTNEEKNIGTYLYQPGDESITFHFEGLNVTHLYIDYNEDSKMRKMYLENN